MPFTYRLQDFWLGSKAPEIANMQVAFNGIFGQGMWIILGSLVAFLVSQIVDVTVFHRIKAVTGEKMGLAAGNGGQP